MRSPRTTRCNGRKMPFPFSSSQYNLKRNDGLRKSREIGNRIMYLPRWIRLPTKWRAVSRIMKRIGKKTAIFKVCIRAAKTIVEIRI